MCLLQYLLNVRNIFVYTNCVGKSREAERKRINKELANIRSKFKGKKVARTLLHTCNTDVIVKVFLKVNVESTRNILLLFGISLINCTKGAHMY